MVLESTKKSLWFCGIIYQNLKFRAVNE